MENTLKFGIAMDGCEEIIIDNFNKFIELVKRYGLKNILYLEIGAAEGRTMKTMNQLLDDIEDINYNTVAIDIENGWSLNYDELVVNSNDKTEIILLKNNSDEERNYIYNRYIPQSYDKTSAIIILIDGNHNYDAVEKDWESAKEIINKLGIIVGMIMFHDSGITDQTKDNDPTVQPKGINVRNFLNDSGLLNNELKNFNGYNLIETIDFQNQNENGRGMFFIFINKKTEG